MRPSRHSPAASIRSRLPASLRCSPVGAAGAGVRYLRKFGGIVSLDLSQLHCHLELEVRARPLCPIADDAYDLTAALQVWDITTEGDLGINEKVRCSASFLRFGLCAKLTTTFGGHTHTPHTHCSRSCRSTSCMV